MIIIKFIKEEEIQLYLILQIKNMNLIGLILKEFI